MAVLKEALWLVGRLVYDIIWTAMFVVYYTIALAFLTITEVLWSLD